MAHGTCLSHLSTASFSATTSHTSTGEGLVPAIVTGPFKPHNYLESEVSPSLWRAEQQPS